MVEEHSEEGVLDLVSDSDGDEVCDNRTASTRQPEHETTSGIQDGGVVNDTASSVEGHIPVGILASKGSAGTGQAQGKTTAELEVRATPKVGAVRGDSMFKPLLEVSDTDSDGPCETTVAFPGDPGASEPGKEAVGDLLKTPKNTVNRKSTILEISDSDEDQNLESKTELPKLSSVLGGKRKSEQSQVDAELVKRRLRRNDYIEKDEFADDFEELDADDAQNMEDDAINANELSKADVQEFYQNVRLNQGAEDEQATPYQMDCNLMRHQKRALAWMVKRELEAVGNQPNGGILADEMGLGKTISIIALMLENQRKESPQGTRWGVLIVCPNSMVYGWRAELRNRISPAFRPNTYIYVGPNRAKSPAILRCKDVVITTYGTLRADAPSFSKNDPDGPSTNSAGPLMKVNWFRVILDEAQNIKNRNSNTRQAACLLKAKNRWAVTGTPMENSVDDFFSLFMFLRYNVCPGGIKQFHKKWTNVLEKRGGDSQRRRNAFTRFQNLLGTVLLRRTKADTIEGKKILELPPKTVDNVKAVFTPADQDFYDTLSRQGVAKFIDIVQQGNFETSYVNLLVILLRLRQAANHPALLLDGDCYSKSEMAAIEEEMESKKGKLDKYGLRIRNQLCSRMRPDPDDPTKNSTFTCSGCDDVVDDEADVLICGHAVCPTCLTECQDSKFACPQCSVDLSVASNPFPATIGRLRAEAKVIHLKAEEKWDEYINSEGPGRLVMSTKLQAIIDELESIRENDEKEKTLVFSQWTTMLDIIGVALSQEGYNFVRLDGSMSMDERLAQVQEFETRSDTTVFLISLKAGGVGLTLTAASRVLIVDPWWNPAVEAQAIDRCYRIGQNKPVVVKKIVIQGTVEERVLEMQAAKLELFMNALGADGASFAKRARLNISDFMKLFNVTEADMDADIEG